MKTNGLFAVLAVALAQPCLVAQTSLDVPRSLRPAKIVPNNAALLRLRILGRVRGNAYQVASTGDSHTASVLAVGADRGVILIDLETGLEAGRCPAPYASYAISSTGRNIAGVTGAQIQLCDPLSPTDVQSLPPSPAAVTSLVFAKDDRFLASGHSDGSVRLWDVTKRVLVWQSPPSGAAVARLALAADRKSIAAVYRDFMVKCWEVGGTSFRQAPQTKTSSDDYVRMIGLVSNNRKVVLGLKSATIVWDIDSNTLKSFSEGADAVSPDERIAVMLGQYLGLGSQGYTPLILWDLDSGKQLASVNTPRGLLAVSAAFTYDGTALLASTNSGEVLVWRH